MVFHRVLITHNRKVVCLVVGEVTTGKDSASPLKSGTENFKKPNLRGKATHQMFERRGGGSRKREPAWGHLEACGCRTGLHPGETDSEIPQDTPKASSSCIFQLEGTFPGAKVPHSLTVFQ